MAIYAESYKEYRRMSGTFKQCVKIRHETKLIECYQPPTAWIKRMQTAGYSGTHINKACYRAARLATQAIMQAQLKARI